MRALDSFTRFVSGLTNGYKPGPLSKLHGETSLYGCGWLYRAAVDRIALDCFRRGYKWVAEKEEISKLEAVESRLDIVSKKQQALQLARLDGEGFVYFDDGGAPDKELVIQGAGDLRFVNVFKANEISKRDTVKDPLSEFYGQPSMYRVGNTDIHPSRVCRVVANRDPSTGNGTPTLKIVGDIIEKAICVRNDIVNLVGEARIDVIKTKGLMESMEYEDDRDAMARKVQQVAQLKANLSVLLLDGENEEYEQKSSSFATLPDVLESIRREVSAALEIPHAILFGREGGLGNNGEMELVTYYDKIATVQKNEVQPAFAYLDDMVIKTATGRVNDGSVYIDWLPLKQPTDKEMQEIGDKIATRHKTLIDSGFDREVLEGPTVNALVEAGVAPGLEDSWNDWVNAGGEEGEDDDEEIGAL